MSKGIDVSYAQGKVDWQKVKAAGIEFAFVRAGYGWDNDQQMDRQFVANVQGCEAQNLSYGVYHYSYARSQEDAAKEARFCLRLMEKAGVDTLVPVAYDLEESFQLAYSDKTLLEMVEAFADVIADAGHYPVVYASASTMNRLYKAGLENLGIMVWVAHWDVDQPGYLGTWDFWQHTAKGKVDGVSGDVDLNYGPDWAEGEQESGEIEKLNAVIAEYKEAITAYEAERNKVVYLVEQLAATLGITPIPTTMSLRREEPPDKYEAADWREDKVLVGLLEEMMGEAEQLWYTNEAGESVEFPMERLNLGRGRYAAGILRYWDSPDEMGMVDSRGEERTVGEIKRLLAAGHYRKAEE